MLDILLDTLIDSLKIMIFLFLTFLIIEFIEHKLNSEKIIKKFDKFGPMVGSLLGAFPQCGFSVSATNFYITRIISLGTLIAVYLSTSDEMLPVLIVSNAPILMIVKIICIKIFIGMLCGFIIDLCYRKKQKLDIHHLCEEEDCHCDEHLFLSALKHTFYTIIFIFIVSLILNIIMYYYGEELLGKIFLKNNVFSPIIASLIGLIPNCSSSVVLTELYLNNSINYGSLIGGLLTGSGVGILVLFKNNKNLKENILITFLIYIIGVLSGIIINLI